MAKSGNPSFQPDWTTWGSQDRTTMQKHAISADKVAIVEAAAQEAQGAQALCSIHFIFLTCTSLSDLLGTEL